MLPPFLTSPAVLPTTLKGFVCSCCHFFSFFPPIHLCCLPTCHPSNKSSPFLLPSPELTPYCLGSPAMFSHLFPQSFHLSFPTLQDPLVKSSDLPPLCPNGSLHFISSYLLTLTVYSCLLIVMSTSDPSEGDLDPEEEHPEPAHSVLLRQKGNPASWHFNLSHQDLLEGPSISHTPLASEHNPSPTPTPHTDDSPPAVSHYRHSLKQTLT